VKEEMSQITAYRVFSNFLVESKSGCFSAGETGGMNAKEFYLFLYSIALRTL